MVLTKCLHHASNIPNHYLNQIANYQNIEYRIKVFTSISCFGCALAVLNNYICFILFIYLHNYNGMVSGPFLTVTKKQLCIWLGLVQPGGKMDYRALNRDYFTPKILNSIGLTEDLYRKKRRFDTVQSGKIIRLFNLEYFAKGYRYH